MLPLNEMSSQFHQVFEKFMLYSVGFIVKRKKFNWRNKKYQKNNKTLYCCAGGAADRCFDEMRPESLKKKKLVVPQRNKESKKENRKKERKRKKDRKKIYLILFE